ncbi:MAG: DUF86 domain-containing protein [Elainella sp. C42_A2020_010]|nr:DUF86 domain-containing protein [Elainella sp. C42_A2020_010]
MPNNRDVATLLDIARAAQRVLDFKQGMNKTDFLEDAKTQSAIVYQLLILGEAVKRLLQDLRVQHPEISWAPIAGMRDNLIHNYDDVDLDEVWRTAERDIPDLLTLLEPLLPSP